MHFFDDPRGGAGAGGTAGESPVCPFCAPEIARHTFLAEEGFRAVYNIAPVLPGHALVIPERHICSLLQLEADELTALVRLARRTTALLVEVFAADGFDWSLQDGTSAGQTVLHLHLHIIPRRTGDLAEPGDWYQALLETGRPLTAEPSAIDSRDRPRLSPTEMHEIVDRLRARSALVPAPAPAGGGHTPGG